MNPRACPETLAPNRNVLCAHYDHCLDTAIDEGWAGFTCGECSDFERLRWSVANVAEDSLACLALLATLSPGHVRPRRPVFMIEHIEFEAREERWMAGAA